MLRVPYQIRAHQCIASEFRIETWNFSTFKLLPVRMIHSGPRIWACPIASPNFQHYSYNVLYYRGAVTPRKINLLIFAQIIGIRTGCVLGPSLSPKRIRKCMCTLRSTRTRTVRMSVRLKNYVHLLQAFDWVIILTHRLTEAILMYWILSVKEVGLQAYWQLCRYNVAARVYQSSHATIQQRCTVV